jgi:putative RNA 2'-phosphotransferase
MTPNQKITKLAKFLSYVLGRKPDEFGLIPDDSGYVKIKDLLKALSEEEGWRYVRRGAIDELCITLPKPPVEINDTLIRAVERDKLPLRGQVCDPPKLLYTCIRQRAHHHVLRKGIFPSGSESVILSPEPAMSLRLGKRIDGQPVQLTIRVETAIENGVTLEQSGDLYIADFIPVGCFTAPALPKEKADTKPVEPARKKPSDTMPGSFYMDLTRDGLPDKQKAQKRKDAGKSWKKDRKQQRKQKEKMWPS